MPARLFAILLRNFADDQGVFEWKPKTLKMEIFPADNIEVEPLLAELELHNQVKKFEESGKTYGAIRNFRRWQRPEKPKSAHPLPNDLVEYVGLSTTEPSSSDTQSPIDCVPSDVQSPTSSQPVADQSPKPISEEGGNSRREERRDLLSETVPVPDLQPKSVPEKTPRKQAAYPEDFEMFWRAYPTDENMSKKEAGLEWARLSPQDKLNAQRAVPGFVAYCRKHPDYRPLHACRWLKQRRFDGFLKGNGSKPPVVEDAARWKARLDYARKKREWAEKWGPKPNEPGCRVPTEMVQADDGNGWAGMS
jgi:hypothetical protein